MRRWTASYRFRWTPVISFDRRRAALLDWVESNLNPVSFRDSDGEVGIALKRGVRVTITRHSMTLEDSVAATDGVASLRPMLTGVIGVIEPREVLLLSGAIAWSIDMNDPDYDHATGNLAGQLTGITTPLASGTAASDIAALMDFSGPRFHIQAEFGVVGPSELKDRLADADVGKLRRRPMGRVSAKAFQGIPATSLFVDTFIHNTERDTLDGEQGVVAAIDQADAAAREVAEAVAKSVVEREKVK